MAFKDARRERGLHLAEVAHRQQVSPHVVRLTIAGDDLSRLPRHGFDHWFRLFLPNAHGETDFSRVPEQFGMGGYIRFLTIRSGTRPVVRNYTVRHHRPEAAEVDIDFIVHGEQGVAGPWAAAARAAEKVALIDQGRGFDLLPDAGSHLLAGDESAMPAILSILRDLPRDARGLALIEVPEQADAQEAEAPPGIEVRWLPHDESPAPAPPDATPGTLALRALREFVPEQPATLSAYVAGEHTLATEGRRHLVASGVPKRRIEFAGYWRAGRAS